MLRKITIPCLACILAAILILPGCGGGKQGTESEAQTQAPKASVTQGGDVAKVLAKAQEIKEISFDYKVTEGEKVEAEGKTWVKGNLVRNEIKTERETVVMIFDQGKQEAYLYLPEQNMATLSKYTPEMTGWFQNPANFYDELDVSLVEIVATETYDGYKCKVMVIKDEDLQEEAKMWVSEEYGIPLRLEDSVAKITIEYKNVKIGSVSDDVFKIPEGVKIEDQREN